MSQVNPVYSMYESPGKIRPVYAVQATETGRIMSLALSETAARKHLQVYRQTTEPQHFRLVKLKVNYDDCEQEVVE